jgi:8-oxo-dGTP pyrophosphatase MutT (NUDIX family)
MRKVRNGETLDSKADSEPRASPVDRLWRLGLWLAYRVLLVCWFVFRPNRRGVYIAVWHDEELLVIRNSYRSCYALPAGGIKRGESIEDAALRELREEVGIVATPQTLHFVREIPTAFEFKRDRCSFFQIELDARPAVRVDGREVVWAGFLQPAETLRRRLAPPVRAYLEGREPAPREAVS